MRNLIVALVLSCSLAFGAAELCPDGSLRLFNPKCGEGAPAERIIPADFRAVFGDPPDPNDYRGCTYNTRTAQSSNACYQAARDQYFQRLDQWVETGGSFVPNELTSEIIQFYQDYDMGVPVFFNTPAGTRARFPDATPQVPFEANGATAISSPGNIVALYQIKVVLRGGEVVNCHPFAERFCGGD